LLRVFLLSLVVDDRRLPSLDTCMLHLCYGRIYFMGGRDAMEGVCDASQR